MGGYATLQVLVAASPCTLTVTSSWMGAVSQPSPTSMKTGNRALVGSCACTLSHSSPLTSAPLLTDWCCFHPRACSTGAYARHACHVCLAAHYHQLVGLAGCATYLPVVNLTCLVYAPLANRQLFVFIAEGSTYCMCRVLPCDHPRSCFTIWLSQTRTRRAFQPAAAKHDCKEPDSTADEAAVARFLMQPSIRQHVCRVVYAGKHAACHPLSARTMFLCTCDCKLLRECLFCHP